MEGIAHPTVPHHYHSADQLIQQHRNLFMRYFGTKERDHYHDLQTKYTAELLRNLLHDPDNFRLHLRSAAAAVVLSLAYGYEVADSHDEYVALLDRVTTVLSSTGLFGTYIVVSELRDLNKLFTSHLEHAYRTTSRG